MAVSETMALSEAPAAAPEQKKEGRLTQLILSLVIFAGFVVLLFVPNTPVGNSLFDQVLAQFGDNPASGLFSYALYAVIGMYAVLLICTVVSLFLRNSVSARLNFLKTVIAILVTLFYIYALGLPLELVFRDPDTFIWFNSTVISILFGGIALIVLLFTSYKAFGFVKLFSVLFSAGFLTVFSSAYIGLYTFADLVAGIDLGTDTLNAVTAIVFQVFACAMLVNFVIALFSTLGKHTAVLDLVRSCVVLALAIAAYVLLGIYDDFLNGLTYLGTIVCTAVALAQFLFALIVLIVLHSKKKKKALSQEKPAASPFIVDANNQMAFRGWEQPVYPAEQPAAAAPAPVFDDAARTNSALEEAAQLSFEDITDPEPASPAAEPAAEPASAYESVIREEPEQPQSAAQDELKEEKPFDFEQARYDGNFNRAYADFTESQQRAPEQPADAAYRTAYQPPRTYAQPSQTGATPYYDPAQGAGYVPDAFINGLTASERDEFNKLFISRIYGENKRLPSYIVGGDNREFFAKVFVFMGRYRNVISDGLLEKIYEYSNVVR